MKDYALLAAVGGAAGLVAAGMIFYTAPGGAAVAGVPDWLLSGVLTVAFSVLGLASSWLAVRQPRRAAKLMIAAAVGGLLSSTVYFALAAVLLLASGVGGLVQTRLNKQNRTARRKKGK